jgi:quercetin dioxygenase-like cupin family protein
VHNLLFTHYQAQTVPARAKRLRKNLNSDEHFDRSFALYRNGNQITNNKGTTMNPLTYFNKIQILPLLIASALIVGAFTPVPAVANPGCGFSNRNLLAPVPAGYFPSGLLNLMCRSNLPDWFLLTRIRGDSDVYVTEVTFQPGGQTGWHSHPGPSMITVTEGTLTVYHDDCTFETYSAGESFTDLGCGDVHNVRNETGAEAKDVAVQIVPHGAMRRNEADDPGCPNVPPCPAF